jgi:hypothetical protein
MTNLAQLTQQLNEAREELRRLAAGYSVPDVTAEEVVDLIGSAQDFAAFMEDQMNRRFTRLGLLDIEDSVNGWFEYADKVAARRGEG